MKTKQVELNLELNCPDGTAAKIAVQTIGEKTVKLVKLSRDEFCQVILAGLQNQGLI
jgi:hypothetical protein